MVAFSYLLLAVPFIGFAVAKPVKPVMLVHDARPSAPRGFQMVSMAAPEQTLDLRLQLHSTNMQGLEAELMAVSTPGNSRYGQHLSKAEVEKFVAPAPESIAEVKAWLKSYGVEADAASSAGDWMKFSVPASLANELFDASFAVYNHTESGETSVHTLEYSLPANLQGHIRLVHPTTTFFTPQALKPMIVAPKREQIARPKPPQRKRQQCSAPPPPPSTPAPTTQPAPPPTTQPAPPPTTQPAPPPTTQPAPPPTTQPAPPPTTQPAPPPTTEPAPPPTTAPAPTTTNPAPPPPPPTSTSQPAPPPPSVPQGTPGQTDPSCSSTITPTCLQQLYGIPSTPATQPNNTLAVTGFIGQYAQSADLAQFLQQYRTDINPSTTFQLQTFSDGQNPQDPSQAGLEANLDTQYTIGVATGVPTTFISVGNGGTGNGFLDVINDLLAQDTVPQVLSTSYGLGEASMTADVANSMCQAYMQLGARGVSILFSSGDSGVGGSGCTTFEPMFPSGCPYVTSVGATDGVAPEKAASFSSGGFSNIFSTPSFQSSAVQGYLSQLGSTNSGLFNSSGRGFPDVSAQGTDVHIINAGQDTGVQGTSCSSPIFAAMIALLNDELAANGKPPLGYLNPWLYGTAAPAFMDVTQGSNPGCGSNGFPAMSGWDPVTGLGSPSYSSLRIAAGLS